MARAHPPDLPFPSVRPRPGEGDGSDRASGAFEEATSARTVPSLLGELLRELGVLARNEAQLARTEMGERLQRAQTGAGGVGTGAVIGIAGLVLLLQSAMLGLDLRLQTPWLSALIVGGAAALIALGLALWGRSRLKPDQLTPRRSAESLQRDADLMRRDRGGATGERAGVPSDRTRVTREEAH